MWEGGGEGIGRWVGGGEQGYRWVEGEGSNTQGGGEGHGGGRWVGGRGGRKEEHDRQVGERGGEQDYRWVGGSQGKGVETGGVELHVKQRGGKGVWSVAALNDLRLQHP